MAKHRTYSIEFKRQVAQEYLGGETLHGLARRHDVSRNLIRIWVSKLEADAHFEAGDNPLLRELDQICRKDRLLEIVHDFMVFDAGTKKTCRHNQYFGVRAAQTRLRRREGGILWHTQGSGKSLIMVWLAKWIRERVTGGGVLIITDRTELDEQIEKIFKGVREDIHRTKSGSAACSGSRTHPLPRSAPGRAGRRTGRTRSHLGSRPDGQRRRSPERCSAGSACPGQGGTRAPRPDTRTGCAAAAPPLARCVAQRSSVPISANITETPAPLGITVGRWR